MEECERRMSGGHDFGTRGGGEEESGSEGWGIDVGAAVGMGREDFVGRVAGVGGGIELGRGRVDREDGARGMRRRSASVETLPRYEEPPGYEE